MPDPADIIAKTISDPPREDDYCCTDGFEWQYWLMSDLPPADPVGGYRVLVTGSREWDSPLEVYERLADVRALAHESGRYDRFIVVHGACPKGADKHAARWCLFPDAFADMPVIGEPHPADWDRHGKRAGFIRNAEMVALGADFCLAFYKKGAGNKGTDHCARLAEAAGIPVRRLTA